MRRLSRRFREERGATAVLVAFLMLPLIGCLAISVDVGSLYSERAQLQNGADAAALAVATSCAKHLASCATPQGVATTIADQNAIDGTTTALTPTFPNNHTVTVSVQTLNTDGTSGASHPFASILGIGATTVHASATAEWGSPSAAAVLPLAMAYCDFSDSPIGTRILVQYNETKPCKGPIGQPIAGGFGWLDQLPGQCLAFVDLSQPNVGSSPGNSPPTNCDAIFSTLQGQTVLIPIYDCSHTLNSSNCSNGVNGQKGVFHIYSFAAFTVTGWRLTGGNGVLNSTDPLSPACSGSCRGIQGYFQQYVDPAAAANWSIGGPSLGLNIVRLTN
jgi:Flp pilus assembly protein TadG